MSKIRATAVVLLAATLFGENALAQNADLPINPDRVALAQKLVDDAKMASTMSLIVDGMMGPMLQQMNTGAGSPELKAYMATLIKSEIETMELKVRSKLAGIYARTFTDDQLRDMTAFYDSPTGQVLIAKEPVLAREGQLAAASLTPGMAKDMLDKLFAHVCEVQHCTPAQRAQMQTAKEGVLAKLNAQPGFSQSPAN